MYICQFSSFLLQYMRWLLDYEKSFCRTWHQYERGPFIKTMLVPLKQMKIEYIVIYEINTC